MGDLRRAKGYKVPVIIVTGTADVPKAVQTMNLGAIAFYEKPVDPSLLIGSVQRALEMDKARLEREGVLRDIARRFEGLTNRERDLVPLICSGLSNKQIAITLHIASKTVKNHRARLLGKVGAINTADLVRLATTASSSQA